MRTLFFGCASVWIIALLISVINANTLIESSIALGLIFMIIKILECFE